MEPEFCAFYAVLIFMWTDFLRKRYLTFRQIRVYETADAVPEKLAHVLDVETFQRARYYGIDQNIFNMVSEWWNIVVHTTFVCYDGFTLIWNLSEYCLAGTRYADSEIVISCVFQVLRSAASTIMALPTSAFSAFVIEEKHGFNRQTLSFFIEENIKNYLWNLCVAFPAIVAIITLVKWGGRFLFVWSWVLVATTALLVKDAYPEIVNQLLNKYAPLRHGPLKAKIKELAKQVDFPLFKIYTVIDFKGSVNTCGYFFGFFNSKKSIALYDTFLKNSKRIKNKKNKTAQKGKRMNDDEILAVLGHEFGRWKLNHDIINTVIFQVMLFITLFAFGWLYDHPLLYRAFGFYETERPVVIGFLFFFYYVFTPCHTVLKFAMTTLNRQLVFRADAFAVKLGKAKALESALIILHNDNLGFPVNDPLYSALNHANPQLLERLEAISKTD